MIKLIKLLIAFLNSAKTKDIPDLQTLLIKLDPDLARQLKGNIDKYLDKKNNPKLKQAKEPDTLLDKYKDLKKSINKISSKINSINRLINKLTISPSRLINSFSKLLSNKEQDKLGELMSDNKQGTQVFLSSSWISWALWEPISEGSKLGVLVIKTKTVSANNPSGIYNFPLKGHPHGYGPYVPLEVYILLKMSASAGKTFWEIWYRQWYNTHRRIGYNRKKTKDK